MTEMKERLTKLEVKQKYMEQSLEKAAKGLERAISQFGKIMTKHEKAVESLLKEEMEAFDARLTKMEAQTEIVRFFVKYPKISILVGFGLYIFTWTEVRTPLIQKLFSIF